MPILQQHYDEIKLEIEKDKGWLLRLHLTNNQHLISEFLKDYPYDDSIGFESESFIWYEFSNTPTEHKDVFLLSVSFVVTGNLILYDDFKEHSRKGITLDVTVKIVCTYYKDSGNIVYIPQDFQILIGELKKISSFDEIVLKEFKKLEVLRPLRTDLYDKTWKFNEPKNQTHEFISSYYYYLELENMNRQSKYFIALANTYIRYANNYFPDVNQEPFMHYPLNFTSHDRRFLDYCASAIHSMYVYWERIALLIFQYHKPKNHKKVNERNLSFAKLMHEIISEQKANTIDLDWFVNFLKADHSKLQLLRHPLVHFKLDPAGHKGSYIAMIYTTWLRNVGNKTELDELEKFSKNLLEEIIGLAKKSYEGYEKAIQLIINLKTLEKPEEIN
jgi:hypothetical protein